MTGLSISSSLDQAKLSRLADGLVVAVAVSLPWSTSVTGILLVLWLVVLALTLEWADIRREVTTAAGGLPVLLFFFGVIGMAWADVSWHERWGGLSGFAKLLVIPLLMAQFRRSGNGRRVFLGFLLACVALLVASFVVLLWPDMPRGSASPGVAVKSYIIQSVEFAVCAAVLLDVAIERVRRGRWMKSVVFVGLSLAFLGDIFFIATGRTTLVIIPALVLLYGFRQLGWKGVFVSAAAGLVFASAVWTISPYLRTSVNSILSQTEAFEDQGRVTSTGERIVFWTKSLRFMERAPLLGHGTGSITTLFRQAAAGSSGVFGEVSTNPHNQTFAVGIQLGLLGIIVLWAMWISQLTLFWGSGLTAWVGLVFVTQNIIGSLFNSFIFDFTEGWLYVLGVGVAAGIIRRQCTASPHDTREAAGKSTARGP